MKQDTLQQQDTETAALEAVVWDILRTIEDPEIPTLSVVDLGIIRRVRFEPCGAVDAEASTLPDPRPPTPNPVHHIVVDLMPTFLGCPALGMMRGQIEERVGALGPVRVEIVRDQPWTSARITEAGRRKLAASGFAPPPRTDLLELTAMPVAACPYCGSRNTRLDSPFGPTACRAIHYCRTCRQPFEQFKAV